MNTRLHTFRQLTAIIALGFACGPGGLAIAEPARSPDYALKAAFLLNFTLFADWPESALPSDAPVVIGVWGDNPFGSVLEDLAKERGGKTRPVRVVPIQSAEEAKRCQIVYLAADLQNEQGRHLQELAIAPVLTVSDNPGFLQSGGTIRFLIQSNKVRFATSETITSNSIVRLSSRLLQLAVKENEP